MIGALRTWLLSIIAAGLVLSILYALLPKGRLRPIVRTAGGVVPVSYTHLFCRSTT